MHPKKENGFAGTEDSFRCCPTCLPQVRKLTFWYLLDLVRSKLTMTYYDSVVLSNRVHPPTHEHRRTVRPPVQSLQRGVCSLLGRSNQRRNTISHISSDPELPPRLLLGASCLYHGSSDVITCRSKSLSICRSLWVLFSWLVRDGLEGTTGSSRSCWQEVRSSPRVKLY